MRQTLVLLLVLGCGDDTSPMDGAVSADAQLADGVIQGDVQRTDGGEGDVGGADAFIPLPVFVYGNTRAELYQLDPRNGAIAVVGDFDCVSLGGSVSDSSGGMTDIAIDGRGTMFGVGRAADGDAFHTLVTIDPATARCTQVAAVVLDGTPSNVQGLSFVGEGSLVAGVETLVGTSGAGAFFSIDTGTGEARPLGTINVSSDVRGGDMVSVRDGATWVITSVNTLVTFDLMSGEVLTELPIAGADRSDSLGWGLGYWGGSVYAFSFNGRLYAIDTEAASLTEIPIPDAPADLSFRGAAVTTEVPLI